MPKVLLSSVCRPFGGPGEGDSVGAELFHAQVTRAQGVYSFRQVIRCWAIDYIAENIDAPSVVLHYPSEREFIRELSRGSYDYVGISFVVATFHKARRMATLVRRYAPAAKVVFGGYGTVLPDEVLRPHADFICREEGIGYMRCLLGEAARAEIRHPYAPIAAPSVYSISRPNPVGHLTAGLGCPNGCDFCCTSHFFKRRYVAFMKSGQEIYEAISRMEQQAADLGSSICSFILIDEDFFLYEQRAREFLECVRTGGRPLSLMGFGSVRGLSQFSADEIAEMGFDTIWTAFEGRGAGYSKLQGESFERLYAELKARGIAVLSSMIVGFPYQDEDKVRQEFAELIQLGPTMTQILIYFAFPGTPLHRQILAEDRYLPQYRQCPDLRKFDGFSLHFKHPHFRAPQLEALQRSLYREEFQRLGPSIVRLIKVNLEGWRNLRDSSIPLLRLRAERKWRMVLSCAPAIVPALFGPSPAARRLARSLLGEIWQEAGGFDGKTALACLATPFLAAGTWVLQRLNILQQPRGLRIEKMAGRVAATASESRREHLGTSPALWLRVAEDFKLNAVRLVQSCGLLKRSEDFSSASIITQPQGHTDGKSEPELPQASGF